MLDSLITERLILRQWRDSDYAPFAKLNADPKVMEYFPQCLNIEESNRAADKIRGLIDLQGWGFWAVELRVTGTLIGFTGLNSPATTFPFSPCVEVGWRLTKTYWGKGYASEAANAALQFGFQQLGLDEIVAFTALQNKRSQAVMKRLGMQYQSDFQHPSLPANHPLSTHCLYQIKAQEFEPCLIN